jgi:hypothetical protein
VASIYSHVLEYSGGRTVEEFYSAEKSDFAGPMSLFDGDERFALLLWRLPEGMSYEQACATGRDALEYLQADGRADALTVESRKAGGSERGANWVRYLVGHPHDGGPAPLDVAIVLPRSTEMISRHEVFDADEAAELFYTYFKTGDIPGEYRLRPVEGYTSGGDCINLRGKALAK